MQQLIKMLCLLSTRPIIHPKERENASSVAKTAAALVVLFKIITNHA